MPEAGETASQVLLEVAVQLKVPPPVLLTFRGWAVGLLPPCWAVKERLVGLAPIAGGTGAAVTVNVTGMLTVVAPVAVIEICPLWLPAARVPVLTVNVTGAFPVAEAGDNVNQETLSLADQLKVPPPVLLIVRVWAAGLTPAWAVKEKLAGLAPMAGATGAAVTVNVTGTVTEEAPVALSITVPV